MKFEEILSALLQGKRIRRIFWSEDRYVHAMEGEISFLQQNGYVYIFGIDDFKADDWEIMKESGKVKLRYLTKEQYKTFVDNKCGNEIVGIGCVNCPFYYVHCIYGKDNKCWIDNKDLYSDKFLDQEIEID